MRKAQRDKKTERQRYKIKRQTDRQTDSQPATPPDRETDRHMHHNTASLRLSAQIRQLPLLTSPCAATPAPFGEPISSSISPPTPLPRPPPQPPPFLVGVGLIVVLASEILEGVDVAVPPLFVEVIADAACDADACSSSLNQIS